MTFKEDGSNVSSFRFQKRSWYSTIQINAIFQAVFLEHEGNLVYFFFCQQHKDHSFVNYAFLCSLGWERGGKGFFLSPAAAS